MASRSNFHSSVLADVPLDVSIGRDRLDIIGKMRSNLFPWNGQFSPQLVHALLENYAFQDCRILDPFMGSGTVLVESARLGYRVFGSEINPAAYQMASTYALMNIETHERRGYLDSVEQSLFISFDDSPLFAPCENESGDAAIKKRLVSLRDGRSHGPAKQLLETLIVLLDFHRGDLTGERVLSRWNDLRATIEELPNSQSLVCPMNCDARNLLLPQGQIDLVLTSPPYINVFNYHQQYRVSAEALGWDLLHVAKSEIGSNRKNRQNRFLTVIQYCLDMSLALAELRRVSKTDARIIMVVGRESNVLRTPFFNADIVASIGTRCVGLKAEAKQERSFKNKFGEIIYEDIIHFRPDQRFDGNIDQAHDVAEEVLTVALERVPQSSIADLKAAIRQLGIVRPSPIYTPQWACEGSSSK